MMLAVLNLRAHFVRGASFRMILFYVLMFMNMIGTPVMAMTDDFTMEMSARCSHIVLEEGQLYNAFYHDDNVCCLCPAGTKLTSYCNSTHPDSTVCDACGKGEYREYSGHMSSECIPQVKKNCIFPWELSKGSKVKADRCQCMLGFEEKLGQCLPLSTSEAVIPTLPPVTLTPKPTGAVTTTPHSNLKKSTDAPIVTKTTLLTILTSTSKSTAVVTPSIKPTVTPTTEFFTSGDNVDHKNVGHLDQTTKGIIAGVVILVVIFVIFVIVFYRKGKGNVSNTLDVAYSAASPEKNKSSEDLVPERKRTTSLSCCNVVESLEEMPALNKAGPEYRPGVMVEGYGNIAAHIPQDQQNLLGANAVNFDPPPEVTLHPVLIRPDQMDSFVSKLANQWTMPQSDQVYIGRENVKPVFRCLFGTGHDATIDSIYASEGHLEEMLYQLLKQLQRNLGRNFTPQYVMEKLKTKNPIPENLISIIKDVLQQLDNNQAL